MNPSARNKKVFHPSPTAHVLTRLSVMISLICILAASVLSSEARKVRLSLKTPKEVPMESVSRPKSERIDSLALAELADSISFAGFDKTAPSSKEYFFIVNDSPWPLSWIKIRLTYRDMSGRMLHRREESLIIDLPQKETRIVTIPTFDKQKSLYYYKSRAPRNGGMPFQVEIDLLEAGRPL